ncbi:MAG: hypothetical protein AAF772_12425 [Acidobacteriota bacterium]
MADGRARRAAGGLARSAMLAAALVAVGCGGGDALPGDAPRWTQTAAASTGDDILALDRARAHNAVLQGRHDWARTYHAAVLETAPDDDDALRGLAFAWVSGYQQSLSEGADQLAALLVRRPDDAEARRRLVQTLLLLGRRDEAIAAAQALGDDDADRLLRAEALLEGDPTLAYDLAVAVAVELDAAPGRDPDGARAARAHALASDAAAQLDRSADARRHARAASARDPLDHPRLYRLARDARRQRDRDAARRWLALHERVRRLRHDGTMAPLPPDDALAELDAFVADLRPLLDDPDALPFLLRREQLRRRFEAGQLDAALDQLVALEDDPSMTLTELATVAVRAAEAGRTATARRLFERILMSLDAASPAQRGSSAADALRQGAIASLAQLDLDGGRLDDARARLDAALADAPRIARFHHLRGLVARAADAPDVAAHHLTEALALAPWEWSWRRDLLELLAVQDRGAAFRRVFADAPESHPALEALRRPYARLLAPSGDGA